jgi:hypothetical protein
MPVATSIRRPLSILIATAVFASGAVSLASADRVAGPDKIPGGQGPSSPQSPGLVVQYATLASVLDCMVGAGVTITNSASFGAPGAFGTFTGGTGIIGFDSGVILSTGNVFNVVGPNQFDNVSTNNGGGGDADLQALTVPNQTFDAAGIEFDFNCDQSSVFSIEYVFGSDEYNEFVNTSFNDVFAFFLDGNTLANDIAVVPAFCSSPGQPVEINTVNCNNPYAPPTGLNCDCYINNDLTDGGGAINTELDGLTHVFARTVSITPGTHHMKIAIADAGDHIYDSDVFIRCSSLACAISTPVNHRSWGTLKTLYR